ncbi:PepSY domain-containing protein [Sporosarcina sp. BI001-red]|uniref:PepSY-associated TM helix domain-containing protein n=1 Tax=Sporosarcina sp. BI001-red TaxID=2282866 RepID=UPI000E2597A3|nr:PepSY domain-containing protein [Sporosarcina sp. BI001-red]REB08787.1 PepSY domain-containing protein [Sporosarcina sp. BI001-red]
MKKGTYNRFWRWHFFGALFMAPLLITLTLSGIGYLFYNNVENVAYKDLFFGNSEETQQLTIDEGISHVKDTYTGFDVAKIMIMDEPYNTRLTMESDSGEEKYVFLDEHNEIVGSQNSKYTYANIMRNIHSSLFVGGTVVNYLVELAACWAIFLLFSGLYMTFKSRALKKSKKETPRLKFKRIHALIGTIITIPMIILIFTGLPWSAFMGNFIYTASQEHPSIGTPLLQQQPPTSDMSEIPWATRKEKAPESDKPDPHANHAGHGNMPGMDMGNTGIPVEKLMLKAKDSGISKPYSIVYPFSEDGVFTVSKGSNTGVTGLDVSPTEEMTSYFDQYSGDPISKVGYSDYGILAKWFTWGIPLHEGHLFGWPNKIINLVVCLAFLSLIFYGFKMWLSRKRNGNLSAPPKTTSGISIGFIVLMIVLGIIMPLFGISLLIVLAVEGILYLVNKGKNPSTEN